MLHLLPVLSLAMYDISFPEMEPPAVCTHGCALWSDLASDGCTRDQKEVDAKWKAGKAPADSARFCSMPANDPGDTYWCYCKDSHDHTRALYSFSPHKDCCVCVEHERAPARRLAP